MKLFNKHVDSKVMQASLRSRPVPGFTLLELAVVTVILTILAAIAVPRYQQTLARHRVDAAARRLMVDLQLAQRRARLASVPQNVVFYPDSASYVLEGIADPSHPDRRYTVDMSAEPYNAVLVAIEKNAEPEIAFDGFGRPVNGLRVWIGAGRWWKMVDVDEESGEITTSAIRPIDRTLLSADAIVVTATAMERL